MYIEKYGRNADWVQLEGCKIIISEPDDEYGQFGYTESRKITEVDTFDTPEEAERVLQEWLTEIIKEKEASLPPLNPDNMPPVGTYAYTAMMMARYSPVEDDPDFWDRWKDEMKDGI